MSICWTAEGQIQQQQAKVFQTETSLRKQLSDNDDYCGCSFKSV